MHKHALNLPLLHTKYHYYVPHVSLMCGFTSAFIFIFTYVIKVIVFQPLGCSQIKNQWKRFLSLTASCENITIAPSTLNIVVGMGVFNNHYKFKSDITYKS